MLEIIAIEPGGTADRLGLRKGDSVISVNGESIHDVIDFAFFVADARVSLEIYTRDHDTRTLNVNKDPDDRLGMSFSPLRIKRCRNKCIFCFVDQMPAGCRKSLYVKDDDFRASFLYGNYITLGSLSEQDWQRIFTQRLSPLYISVHSTERELRSFIIGNKRAPDIMESLKRLAAGGILMHTQIVLCPGVNDGVHLEKTLDDLSCLFPAVGSIAVVPAGITACRNGLFPLKAFTKKEARNVVDFVTRFGDRFKRMQGTRLAFASDEFYIKASLPMPSLAFYEDLPQLENGVGMVADFLHAAARTRLPAGVEKTKAALLTGVSFSPLLRTLLTSLRQVEGLTVNFVTARNSFFGNSVTVAGLLTGSDIRSAFEGTGRRDMVFIPADAVSEGGLFLDGMSVGRLSELIGSRIIPVRSLKDIAEILRERRRHRP